MDIIYHIYIERVILVSLQHPDLPVLLNLRSLFLLRRFVLARRENCGGDNGKKFSQRAPLEQPIGRSLNRANSDSE